MMVDVWINITSEKMPAHIKKHFESSRDALNYLSVCDTMLVVEVFSDGPVVRAKIPALSICEPVQNIKYINRSSTNGLGINESNSESLEENGWFLTPTMYKFLMKIDKFAKDNNAVEAVYEHTTDRSSPINEWLRQF